MEKNGGWAPACSDHVYTMNNKFYSPKYAIPQNTKTTLAKAVKRWM